MTSIMLQVNQVINNFKVLRVIENLHEINMKAIELEHIETGMQVLKLVPLDLAYNEATFSITFRTPPIDSSGVQHITEHSVLCGSEKFPTKEPFSILLQSSLQTFLNAMTYNEHTVYPIATRSEKDYYNLANVYLDAVFFPLLQKDDRIFAQEGHHIHLEEGWKTPENRGVVLNEMKGVFSDPSSCLDYKLCEHLFQNATCGHNSGGNPQDILKLTYKQFSKFHKEHYTAGNANVVFISQYSLERDLEMLNSYIERQPKVRGKKEMVKQSKVESFSVHENYFGVSDENDKGFFARGQILYDCDSVDPFEFHALNIIDSLLHDAHATPLKKQLFGDKLAQTLESSLDYSQNQAYIRLTSKGVDQVNFEQWRKTIEQFYIDMIKDNDYLNEDALEGALNKYEFKKSEMTDDYGIHKMAEIQLSWLYGAPFEKFLEYSRFIQFMRNLLQKKEAISYMRKLIDKFFVKTGGVYLKYIPQLGLSQKEQDAEKQSLQSLYEGMTDDQKKEMIDFSKHVHSRQELTDSPELLASFPKLTQKDLVGIVESNRFLAGTGSDIDGKSLFFFDTKNDNIVYQNIIFDLSDFVGSDYQKLLPLSMLKKIYAHSDTDISLDKLQSIIDKYIGNFQVELSGNEQENGTNKVLLVVKYKYLLSSLKDANEIVASILTKTQQYLSVNRLQELIDEYCQSLKSEFMGRSGYYIAQQRAAAGMSSFSAGEDYIRGYELYQYLKSVKAADLLPIVQKIMDTIIKETPCLIGVGIVPQKQKEVVDNMSRIFRNHNINIGIRFDRDKVSELKPVVQKHLAAQQEVNYVALAHVENRQMTSAGLLAQQILSKVYLWDKVRVLGGAYGCFLSSTQRMTQNLVSYRDPHIQETIQIFRGVADYVRALDLTEEQLTQFKIGAIGERQRSLAPKDRFAQSIGFYLNNNDVDKWCDRVEGIRDVTLEQLKAVAQEFEKLSAAKPVVFGNLQQLKKTFGDDVEVDVL